MSIIFLFLDVVDPMNQLAVLTNYYSALTCGIQCVSRVSNMVHGPLVFNKPNLLGAIIKIFRRKKIPYKIIIRFLK